MRKVRRCARSAFTRPTTDAVVIAAGTGEGILIRTGVKPGSLEVERDRVAIARFLVARGYGE